MAIRNLLYLLIFLCCTPILAIQQKDTLPVQNGERDSLKIQQLKSTYTEQENWEGLIELYYGAANELFGEREFQAALEQYLKVDSIAQLHKIVNKATIRSIVKRSEISRTAFTQQSSDYAHLLLEEALANAREINDQESIHYIYLYLADTSGLKGEYEKAKEYIDLALEYFLAHDKREYEPYIARLYMISTAYYKVNDRIDKAQEAYLKGIAYTREKENKLELAKLLYYYGHFQGGYLGGCKDAMVSLLESKSIYDSLNLTDTYNYERLNRDLADCYLEDSNYQKASEHYRIAYDLKSSLSKKANREVSRRVEAQYQTEKKEQQIALLNAEKELIEQQKVNQRNLLLGGIGVTSLIGVFLFFQYQNRQKTNKKLQELDRLKSNFFANISHEFRTPLTLISGPVEQRINSGELSKTDRRDFEMIQRNSNRLLNLVNQLLDLSKLEAGKYQLRAGRGNLSRLLRAQGEAFQFLATEKEIDYQIEISELEDAWFDKDIIEKITTNLLSNAIKYCDHGGYIRYNAHRENDKVSITITNSSSTLNTEVIEKAFNRFYQQDPQNEGVGIGLSLVEELVQANGGSVSVNPKLENVIEFIVMLPINKSAFKPHQLVNEPVHSPSVAPDILSSTEPQGEWEDPEEFFEKEDRDILLLVEDHPEVRDLLKNQFSKKYKIVEATNGKEGVKQAMEWVPDLIISDIMMPEMDGLELSKILKTDERTSHIPIILLTARAGEEDQYKGLTTGADAYVTKPFKSKLLQTRVQNLIESRKALRDRYSQEVILKPKDIAITNLDEIFLERVQEVLDLKLTESAFSTQEFAEAVGMSRMQLHRKLKALTGLSASEFVRSQRLKLAASLLQKSDANISEIGYQVGFNDPSYFTKCFREAYGVSPSAFSKNKPS
ncbi:MAG: response regulator [Eudoraea sp.]|nr:response regulator [Eudoraea sp.]